MTAAAPAQTLMRDDGVYWVQLPGAAVLTNVGGQTLIVSVSATAAEQGQLIATVTESVALAPGQTLTLPPPPGTGPWVLLSVPRQTAVLWGWGLGLALGAGALLSAYGAYAVVRDVRQKCRTHKQRRAGA